MTASSLTYDDIMQEIMSSIEDSGIEDNGASRATTEMITHRVSLYLSYSSSQSRSRPFPRKDRLLTPQSNFRWVSTLMSRSALKRTTSLSSPPTFRTQ
ncbi:hypothetical protein QQF64_018526 [Cirrhinus molitorella]|uniref:Uncharacterized protein n=1 Tax=Cirrhinus molitorella TaxID=172907 RepID=A0ABR3LCU0_9TELE